MATPSFSFEGTLTLLHPPAIIHPAVTSHHTTITPTTKLRKPGRLSRRPRQLSSTVGLSSRSDHQLSFFLFPFGKKSLICLIVGTTLFSIVPPSNSLVSVSDPSKAFRGDKTPFKGP